MTVLHVVRVADAPRRPDACDAQAVVCAAVIARSPDLRHRVLLVGPAAAARRAAALGLRSHGRVAPVLGRCGGTARAISRVAKAWGAADLVQTYGLDTVAAAAAGADRILLADCLGGIGLDPPALRSATADDLLPDAPSRQEARESLGIAADELLVLALGDPPDSIDAHAIGEAVAMLNVAGIRAAAVLPEGARGLPRVERHMAEGYMQRLIVTPRPVWTLLAGADVALISPTAPGINLATRLLAGRAAAMSIVLVAPPDPALAPLGDAVLAAPENRGSHLASTCFRWIERGKPAPAPASHNGPAIADTIIAAWSRPPNPPAS